MKVYKAGIIGCGAIFPMHAASINNLSNVKLTAICDIKEERVKAKAEGFDCKAYTDYKKMIDEEELDVIHICTPHYLHAPIAIYAANAGLHIMTEKPMSIKLEDAKAMIAAAKENNVALGVIFQNRYNKGSVFIKKALQEGKLGRVLSAKCFVTWYRSNEYYTNSDWRGTWDKEGGGVIINQSIHTLDLMNWLIDDEIEYIDAHISNRFHEAVEVEDIAEGIIKYKNGVITSFFAMLYYTYDAPIELELHCEKGIAKMVADEAEIRLSDGTVLTAHDNEDDSIDYGDVKNYWGVSHYKQIKNFYESIEKGKTPDISGDEALKTQAMICGIYQSGKANKRIYL